MALGDRKECSLKQLSVLLAGEPVLVAQILFELPGLFQVCFVLLPGVGGVPWAEVGPLVVLHDHPGADLDQHRVHREEVVLIFLLQPVEVDGCPEEHLVQDVGLDLPDRDHSEDLLSGFRQLFQ